jgi:cell division protease FtsH
LQRSTDIARAMVTEWGMSERLGLLHVDPGRRNRFLDVPQPAERGAYSEDTARLIDEEVKMIVTEAHNDARRILMDKRDLLETVTRRLLEQEVMEGDELRAILDGKIIENQATNNAAATATPTPSAQSMT